MAVSRYTDSKTGATNVIVKTYGFREFSRAVRDFEPQMWREVQKEIRESARPLVEKAKQEAAPMRKTGTMEGSIRVSVLRNGVRIAAGGAKAPYAPVIEFAYKGGGSGASAKGGGFRRTQRSRSSGLRSIRGGKTAERNYSPLTRRYGPPPRYLYRAVDATEEATFNRIDATVRRTMNDFWQHRWSRED